MSGNFKTNLRAELDYQELTVKELSAKTGIAKSTLDCYLSTRSTMPPADTAVRIAQALNVSVERLVTGTELSTTKSAAELARYRPFRDIIDDLLQLDDDMLFTVRTTVHSLLEAQKSRKQTAADTTPKFEKKQ